MYVYYYYQVTIMKGEKGYGFSVYNYNPVYVTQATKGNL